MSVTLGVIFVVTTIVSLVGTKLFVVLMRECSNMYENSDGHLLYVFSLLPLVNIIFLTLSWTIDAKEEVKNYLEKNNNLYKCNNKECLKYFRKYQMELASWRLNKNAPCPHCEQTRYGYPEYKIMEWHKTHPDCPELNFRKMIKYIRTKKKIKILGTNIENIDSFMNYQKETGRL